MATQNSFLRSLTPSIVTLTIIQHASTLQGGGLMRWEAAAIVAGVAPRGPSADGLLWPGATLELGGVRRREGLQVVASALRQWTPDMAATNYRMALSRLDWRWRFKALADVFGIHSASLDLGTPIARGANRTTKKTSRRVILRSRKYHLAQIMQAKLSYDCKGRQNTGRKSHDGEQTGGAPFLWIPASRD